MTIRRWIASSYYARTRNSALPLAMLFLACAAPLCAQTRAAARHQAAERADRADDRAARDLAEAGLKGERAAEKRLLLALDGPKGKARYAAIRSLGLLRSKSAAGRLAGLTKSKDVGEREMALDALARTGAPEAAPAVAAACRADDPAGCRALQWLGNAEAEPALRGALKSPKSSLRAAAAFALARLGTAEAGPAAVGLLKDPAPSVRVEAAQALAALGDASFLDEIEAASANEADALARQTLEAAARRLRR